MSTRERRWLPLLAALAGLAAVAMISWASVSGPVGTSALRVEPGRAHVGTSADADGPSTSPRPTASPSTADGSPSRGAPSFYLGVWLLVGVGVLLVVWALTRLTPRVRRAWQRRTDRHEDGDGAGAADVLPTLDDLAAALAADTDHQLTAVGEGTPRNGIVAAWSRLEQVTAAGGLPREPWETAAEFTVRMLHAMDLDPGSAGRLADLYRLARFSTHELTEDDRDRAREALRALRADLEAAR